MGSDSGRWWRVGGFLKLCRKGSRNSVERVGASIHRYGARIAHRPQRRRPCRVRSPSTSRVQPSVLGPIAEDPGRGPFAASSSDRDRATIPRSRSPQVRCEDYSGRPPQLRLQQRPPHFSPHHERAQTPPDHTRTCNKLWDVYMCTSAVLLMDLDRGTLARIDRKLLAGLGGLDPLWWTAR